MALSELLKMLYNLAVFYPRIKTLDPKADVDSSAEETVSPSSSASSPETEALPATSKSTALGRGLRSMWSRTGTRSRPTSPSSSPKSPVPKGLDHLASALVRLIVLLPHQSDQPLSGSPLGGALLSLGELPASSCWFTDRNVPAHAQIAQSTLPSTSTQPDVESIGTLPPLPAKLVSVLDNSLEYCFPGDVEGDDAANRKRLDRAGRAVEDLDAELAPLLLIIRKCVVSDEQGAVGATLRARLLSNNM